MTTETRVLVQTILHAIDQAETALGEAGIQKRNIYRWELREAHKKVCQLQARVDELEHAIWCAAEFIPKPIK